MGEIEEALRRAREERSDGPKTPPARTREPAERIYSASADLHETEQRESTGDREEVGDEAPNARAAREPSPPAPRAAAETTTAATSPGIELTQLGPDARAPQGVLVDDGGAVTDACLQLALRVRKALLERNASTLTIVSALRNEGKTTVSCNLALALASLGQVDKVALVDLDLRRPSVETVFELSSPTVGIDEVLAEREPLEAARLCISSPSLDVYACLRGQPKAHELLLAPRFEQVVGELRERYDVVIFDSPPSLLVPDSTIIMQHVECFAPVARVGMTRARNFRKMLEMLPRNRLLGGILDGGTMAARKGYYDRYAPDEDETTQEAPHGP